MLNSSVSCKNLFKDLMGFYKIKECVQLETNKTVFT